jgi:hypothetical protein
MTVLVRLLKMAMVMTAVTVRAMGYERSDPV